MWLTVGTQVEVKIVLSTVEASGFLSLALSRQRPNEVGLPGFASVIGIRLLEAV